MIVSATKTAMNTTELAQVCSTDTLILAIYTAQQFARDLVYLQVPACMRISCAVANNYVIHVKYNYTTCNIITAITIDIYVQFSY